MPASDILDEHHRAAKLNALRRDIREGMESGPSAPLDIEALKAEGRRRLAAAGIVRRPPPGVDRPAPGAPAPWPPRRTDL
ncbi:hypothetical protein MKL09_14860 [Methylobacterium sp. J-048]|uniref:hypothetical protein n=1 Tax=Methylobacterium sp. J-048 TaxID=2836635 RepID=UPI001FB91F37|nr:hypothetical protein [Methylobacterium sp. J-048]MCJ2057832.1 hypothetical protein [Methylobacterium sp. J-048]